MKPFALVSMAWSAALAAQAPAAERSIAGRVVDLRGEPVPEAEVWVADDDDARVVARTHADGEGLFLLPRVPPRDGWNVRATVDGMVVGCERPPARRCPARACGSTWIRRRGRRQALRCPRS